MTALLTENLPLLAGSPNGIKKLRELILELAVHGKLVPQDPSDEPASELLERIAEEKARLVVEGKIRKLKTLAEITEEEKPFEIPSGWRWVRLAKGVIKLTDGEHLSPPKSPFGMPLLTAKDVTDSGVLLENTQFVTVENGLKYRERCNPDRGDILICSRGTIGRCAAVETDQIFCLMGSVILVKPSANTLYRYMLRYLQTTLAQQWMRGASSATAVSALYLKDVANCLLPLPPLAEQHRIVAKVDELMALCDRLEAQQADAESAHARLVQALLDSLTQASDAADFAASWQRLAAHFHTLFTSESSIDALKQNLLQLAMMGKLVPQDPNDEPASALLNRITEEKVQLVDEGKIKKQKPLEEITEEEKPYELPVTWAWTRLGSQVIESGAGWSPSCEARPRDGDEWGVLKVSAVSWGIYQPKENKALPSNLEARPEHEVAEGDFLVSRANTAELVARSVVVEETPNRLMLSDKIVRLKLTPLCARRYVNLANSAPLARRYYSRVAGGTSSSMKNVSREQILNLPIALPPLAEQHRIVAKLDHLVALCDTLKRQINAATEKQTTLLNAFMAQV